MSVFRGLPNLYSSIFCLFLFLPTLSAAGKGADRKHRRHSGTSRGGSEREVAMRKDEKRAAGRLGTPADPQRCGKSGWGSLQRDAWWEGRK